MPYDGSWTFAVKPIHDARGYLWSFVQDGVIRWQNLAFEHRLSGRVYTIAGGSIAHRHLHPGTVFVWVQALLRNERWSGVRTLTVHLRVATRPKPPTTSGVLFEATVANGGLNRFNGTHDWKHLNGMLINDGSGDNNSWLATPYTVQGTANYAVEIEAQVTSGSGVFGIITHKSSAGYYAGAITTDGKAVIEDNNYDTLANGTGSYTPDNGWHTYRFEANGNTLRLLVDGNQIIQTTDNKLLSGGISGIVDAGVQMNVRAIRVIAL